MPVRHLTPAQLTAAFLLCLVTLAASALGGFLLEERAQNRAFRQQIDVEVRTELRAALCGFLASIQPQNTDERAVGAYGNRIQDGSRSSGLAIGCNLPPLPAAPSPTPTR
jgi:hypothetical protein